MSKNSSNMTMYELRKMSSNIEYINNHFLTQTDILIGDDDNEINQKHNLYCPCCFSDLDKPDYNFCPECGKAIKLSDKELHK